MSQFVLFAYLGIAGLAPRASYSLSTATKSNQKRPPLQLRPCKEHRGSHLSSAIIMLCQNSQTTLRHAGIESPRKGHWINGLLRWISSKVRSGACFYWCFSKFVLVCVVSFCFFFWYFLALAKPLRHGGYHGFSVPACLSPRVFCVGEFWCSMLPAMLQWEPLCLLQGRQA